MLQQPDLIKGNDSFCTEKNIANRLKLVADELDNEWIFHPGQFICFRCYTGLSPNHGTLVVSEINLVRIQFGCIKYLLFLINVIAMFLFIIHN